MRLLLSAQESAAKEYDKFNQNTFETFMPEYSKRCLEEIREELYALYSPQEVEEIVSCFRGYKASFSFDDIKKHIIDKISSDSLFAVNTVKVLNDLYRVGFVGNKRGRQSAQWVYNKNQESLLTDDSWQIVIHPALLRALTISTRNNRQSRRIQNPVYQATILSIKYASIIVSFEKDGEWTEGYIPIWRLGNQEEYQAGTLDSYFFKDDILNVCIVYNNPYDDNYGRWNLYVV